MTTSPTNLPAFHLPHVPPVVRSAAPTPLAALLNPLHLVATLWRNRELIRQFTVRETVERHRGTHLGLLWSVINPLLVLAVYTFVFGVILRQKWDVLGGSPAEFPLTMLCGVTVFTVFADAVSQAPALIVNRAGYVTKVIFPLEIFPVTVLGSGLFYAGIGLVLIVGGTGLLLHAFSPTIWLFPVVLLPLIFLSLGLSWFLSSLGVFLRDINSVVAIVVQRVMMFLTPIFYPVENVPDQYRFLIDYNPLTPIVENSRRTLMWGQWPDWASLGIVTVISLVVMQLGYAFFVKSKRGFADVL